MAVFYKREDLLNLLSEDFYQYYRVNRNHRYEQLTSSVKVNAMLQKLFGEMHIMLSECNHGIVLNNFGVIAPKDYLKEDKKSIFKVKYKKTSSYKVFLENEYLQSQYKTYLSKRYKPKNTGEKVTEVKNPRPYAVLLHRKKIRKNNLKDG